jgi:hypothetical protein
MTHSPVLPNLILAQRVVDKMAKQAARFVHDETGEALVGVMLPAAHLNGAPTLVVLDTLPADESEVERAAYAFAHGGESQFEAFTWLLENWQRHTELRAHTDIPSGVPLAHLGDWHKQPGHMIAPSGGDLQSALMLLADNPQIEQWLAPIVTLDHSPTLSGGADVNYLTVPDGHGGLTRIDFWLIDRHTRSFRPIHPTVYPDAKLPTLPAMPWVLTDESRVSIEVGQLEHEGWLVSDIVFWDTDLALPLEACLMLGQPGAEHLWLIATPWDYPARPPRAYRAPFVALNKDEDIYDLFERVWREAEPVSNPDDWTWSDELYLTDYMHALTGVQPTPPDTDEEDTP